MVTNSATSDIHTSTTWFITGGSRGVGRLLTEQLLAGGHRVAATARRPEELDELAAQYGRQLWVRALDVTETARLRSVLDEAFSDLGRIEVVVSNAGSGTFGTAEDVTDGQVEGMIATNLVASVQLARYAVPYLRAQGGGRLIQLSSMGGHIAYPGFSLYHTAKWGMEGFYEALAPEVEPFGIRTVLVEPGMIRSGFFDAATRVELSTPYRGNPAVDHPPIAIEEMPGDPAKVAAAIRHTGNSSDPPRRLLLGSDAYRLVRSALAHRLADVDTQRDTAAVTDINEGSLA